MEIPEETKPKRGETGGTVYDVVLGSCHLDGMDAGEGVETLTALALAYLWDDPVNNNFAYPWAWRR